MLGKAKYAIGPSIRFEVDANYVITAAVGEGAYGTVVKGQNSDTGEEIAIKRIRPFGHVTDAKRTLRELKILGHLDHPNIIGLKDIMSIGEDDADSFTDLYIVTDLMDTDLHQIIQSAQPLEESHFKYFMYQLCKGLKYLHSANTLHRDLKPQNLLLNSDSLLKICDFGLSRVDDLDEEDGGGDGEASVAYTEYVVTRWYRAPEVICDRKSYGKALDMWSVGCIFAEMLGRQVLLPGRDQVHQLSLILELVGTPPRHKIKKIKNKNARNYVKSYRFVERRPFTDIFPGASVEACDLLEHLLLWDPEDRYTAEDALEHPFLQDYRDPDDEPECPNPFISFDFEKAKLSIDTLRRLIYNEMLAFHPELGEHIPSTQERELALTEDEIRAMDI